MSSDYAIRCGRIIEDKTLKEDTKVERLKFILGKDPTCVLAHVHLSGGPSRYGLTGTLLYAAVCGGYQHIVRLLLDHNVDVNMPSNFGYPPLFAACSMAVQSTVYLSIVLTKLLLDHGADVNVQGHNGQTPLAAAIEYRHGTEVADLLLRYGARVTPKCLQWSVTFKNPIGARLLIKYLLMSDPSSEKPSFLYAFHYAILFWEKCKANIEAELDLMKQQHLRNSLITVYDIFVADERKLAFYVQNDAMEDLRSNDCKKMFPIYYSKLKRQYRKGMERLTFKNQGYIVMDHWEPSIFNLHVRQKIFEYLEIPDLKKLKEAAILVLDEHSNM